MSKNEQIDFENKLQSNPKFKELVKDVKTMLIGIETQALKEQLDEFHKDLKNPTLKKPSSKNRLLQWVRYAAAAILVVGLAGYLFFGKPSNEKLYVKYFKPDPGLPTTMSTDGNFEFYDAMVYYKHGDYDKAIKKWQALYAKQSNNDTINYFLGLAYMSNKSIKEAIPLLKKVVKTQKSFPFLNEAHYYLGLAYLKEGQLDLAKENLSLSSTEPSKRLLSELKN